MLQLPGEESQRERLAKAGAAPFGWRLELQDMHQLSRALTLHSLSHCCSFSPLSVSLCPKGQTKKLCQGHSELPGNQGCLPWSSCKEEIRIREQHPHRISPGSGCTEENCSEMRAGGHSPCPGEAADPDPDCQSSFPGTSPGKHSGKVPRKVSGVTVRDCWQQDRG